MNGGDNCSAAVYYEPKSKALAERPVIPSGAARQHCWAMKQPNQSPPATDTAIANDAARRKRIDTLVRLLPMWPAEIADLSLSGRARIVARLARALREERRRGKAGHWAYNLARHAQLGSVWRQERAALEQLQRSEFKPNRERT